MIKVKATCGFGFAGAEYEEEFEFDDDYTGEEIDEEIWEWAQQFLDLHVEIVEEEE